MMKTTIHQITTGIGYFADDISYIF